MEIKQSITFKIVLSYIFIIVSSLLIVGLLFGSIARAYSERQSRNQLIKDANAIYDIILSELKDNDISSAAAKQEIQKKIFNQIGAMGSNFALVSKDLRVLYPKSEEAEKFKGQVLPQISKNLNSQTNVFKRIEIDNIEYLMVILPPRNNVYQGLRGYIVLYNPVGPVQKLMKAMILVLLVSLMLAAIIAIFAGVIMARNIARPIILLKKRADSLSKLDFDGSVDIHTGDELEDLAETINRMAVELKEYDATQKMFFQNASHELKTPLMSIQGYAEGIKDKVFDNDDEALDIIVEESKRLKGIVEELIFLSKIESKTDYYNFSRESMNKVLSDCAEKLKGISLKNNIRISLILDRDISLNMDREKMVQALINIMGNCLRYAKSSVTVTTRLSAKLYLVEIRDDGDGFTESELKHIFERFYKGRNGNSGLGLAITKSIIERHKGSIAASDCAGGGAVFTITLPREISLST